MRYRYREFKCYYVMYKEANSEKWRQETFWLHDNGADRMRILKMAIELIQVLESKGCAAEILYSDRTTKVSNEELQEAVKQFPTRITEFK